MWRASNSMVHTPRITGERRMGKGASLRTGTRGNRRPPPCWAARMTEGQGAMGIRTSVPGLSDTVSGRLKAWERIRQGASRDHPSGSPRSDHGRRGATWSQDGLPCPPRRESVPSAWPGGTCGALGAAGPCVSPVPLARLGVVTDGGSRMRGMPQVRISGGGEGELIIPIPSVIGRRGWAAHPNGPA
jgi:hypothetical protein